MIPIQMLKNQVEQHPYRLTFATLRGAYLYGFPSPDSDFHLRGVHLLPLKEVVGLQIGPETIERTSFHEGIKIDLVTHDAQNFFRLLLTADGSLLEEVFSPLIVQATPEHAELKEIAAHCITRHHARHYIGCADKQWRFLAAKKPRRFKTLLFIYRLVLTGTHLMQTGMLEMNLARLNETAKLPYLDDLIAQKRESSEKRLLTETDLIFHRGEYQRLRDKLHAAYAESDLPDAPRGREALHDLLVRLRLSTR